MTYDTLAVRGARLFYKVRGHGVPLLVLQGGGGTADAPDGLANGLEGQHTIISYDRRGLLRSPVDDPKEPISIERHAEDALSLLDALGIDTAFVFATSLGALIGLELLVREPERVKLLVAHEPPALELLSEEWRARVAELRREVLKLALSEGPRAALRRALAGMGVDRDDREDDCEPPLSSREQSRETGFLLSREVRAMDNYRLDLEGLRRYAQRIVPAFGGRSREFYPAQCALALAKALDREPVEFPGSHNGYVLRPRAFAEKLGPLLAAEIRESWLRNVAGSEGDELTRVPTAS